VNGATANEKVGFIFLILGFGVFFYANGSRYEGHWDNNLK
jgi:hypothetical protein